MDLTQVFSPEVLVILAGGSFVIGYLIINQVILRLLLLFGSVIYIAYYATAADEPLWGAIWLSILMIAANLVGLGGLFARQAHWSVPSEHRDIARHFSHLPPGDIRTILKQAKREVLRAPRVITREGTRPKTVNFVLTGHMEVEKQGQHFFLPPGLFAGEVAYLLNQPSAATTTLPIGSEVLTWQVAEIEKRARRSPRFRLAMEAAMSKDLATKVAGAVAVQNWAAEQSATKAHG